MGYSIPNGNATTRPKFSSSALNNPSITNIKTGLVNRSNLESSMILKTKKVTKEDYNL